MQDTTGPYMVSFQDQTTVHPVGFLALMICCVAMLLVPRRAAIIPILILLCFIPSAQRIVVVGLDFTFVRIAIVAGWLRLLLKGELGRMRWCAADTVLVLWALVESVAYVSLHGTYESFVGIAGQMFDALGSYFLIRNLIRGFDDVERVARAFAYISVPVVLFFIVEKITARNLFSVFGGVPELTIVRSGKVRCQGAFPHPILAGTFWTSFLPLIGALYFVKGARTLCLVGGGCSLLIIVLCASSTPLGSLMVAIIGVCLVPWRRHLWLLRWGMVATLCALHAVMKAPVWHLLARLDLTGSSDGYHRYHIVDGAINFFPEWALNGTLDTAHWGWELEDVTNQYVLEGVQGGALALVLFLVMMAMCFSKVGKVVRAATGDKPAFAFGWALGLCLLVHAVNFFGVSYFGQVTIAWHLTLALIVSYHECYKGRRSVHPVGAAAPRTAAPFTAGVEGRFARDS